MTRAVDLFAGGPAGWDLAAHAHGIDSLGLEWDRHACATRAAIGLPTIRADVAAWPTHRLAATGIDVLLGSPPCTMFSAAGTRSGVDAVDLLAPAIRRVYAGDDVRADVIDAIATELTPTVIEELVALNNARALRGQPPRSIDVPGDAAVEAHRRARMAALVLEPARYAHDLTPDVIALEQVPEVLPLWRVLAEELRLAGYSAWAGVLNAADFGVPQTRRRAILIANRTHTITAPEPTHAQNPTPSLFGELAPWVTMADALGWHPDTTVGFPRLDDKGDSTDGDRARDWRPATLPALALTEKARSYTVRPGGPLGEHVKVNTGRDWKAGGTRADAQQFDADADAGPAPTLDRWAGCWRLSPGLTPTQPNRRLYDPDVEPAPTIAFGRDAASWLWTHPATTLTGDPRISARCHHGHGTQLTGAVSTAAAAAGDGTQPVRLTIAEALILQSFPPDLPLAGPSSAQFLQVGNAIPPLLGYHALAAALGT